MCIRDRYDGGFWQGLFLHQWGIENDAIQATWNIVFRSLCTTSFIDGDEVSTSGTRPVSHTHLYVLATGDKITTLGDELFGNGVPSTLIYTK